MLIEFVFYGNCSRGRDISMIFYYSKVFCYILFFFILSLSMVMVRNNVNIYFYYNIVNCADNVCTNILQCNVALKISQTNVIFIYFFKKQRWHSCQPFASNTTFIEAVQKVHWWCQKVSKAVQEISPRDFECSSSCSRTQDGPEIVKATNGALANDQTGSYT